MRNNRRFISFILNHENSELLNKSYHNGLFIYYKQDGTNKPICVPEKYGKNTYSFNLASLSDEEYEKYENYFLVVVEPYMITDYAVVLYYDEDVIIYMGDIKPEKRKENS